MTHSNGARERLFPPSSSRRKNPSASKPRARLVRRQSTRVPFARPSCCSATAESGKSKRNPTGNDNCRAIVSPAHIVRLPHTTCCPSLTMRARPSSRPTPSHNRPSDCDASLPRSSD
jgi:hypothetical protein